MRPPRDDAAPAAQTAGERKSASDTARAWRFLPLEASSYLPWLISEDPRCAEQDRLRPPPAASRTAPRFVRWSTCQKGRCCIPSARQVDLPVARDRAKDRTSR